MEHEEKAKELSELDEILNIGNSKIIPIEDIQEKVYEFIGEFNKWLYENNYSTQIFDVTKITVVPSSHNDWIMKVNKKGNVDYVEFNPHLIEISSLQFFEVVILHEFFHLLVQKVPNKDDATKIKDYFGTDFMSLIDIEADFYVALYYKKNKKWTNKKYWEVYFEGVKVFKDEWIRNKKFERFLGSILTINKMFLKESFDLYLPSLSSLITEDNLKIIVLKKEHIYFDTLSINLQKLTEVKDIYLTPTEFEFDKYFEVIQSFYNNSSIK